MFGVHAPPGTGVAEVFGDLVAAIVTERARRIAELANPAAAFGETRTWGPHTVTEPAGELAGFEIVLTAPDPGDGLVRSGTGLPPIGTAWRDRAVRADYFASTARLADGVGAWAMLAARLGDRAVNRAFADRWWHGAVRGADVLFPAGESMAAALRRLKGTTVYWPACVSWFRSALEKVRHLAAERMEVAAALTRLSLLEQACEEASLSVETARCALADLVAREPAAREAVTAAEEAHLAALAALGAHELGRPELAAVTPQVVAALWSHGALSVALADGGTAGPQPAELVDRTPGAARGLRDGGAELGAGPARGGNAAGGRDRGAVGRRRPRHGAVQADRGDGAARRGGRRGQAAMGRLRSRRPLAGRDRRPGADRMARDVGALGG